jgi:hypothetical protein
VLTSGRNGQDEYRRRIAHGQPCVMCVRRRRRQQGLLRAPGSTVICLRYMFPGRGKVLASGRRFREPFVEVVYTLWLYVMVGSMTFLVWFMH